jgi:hypothetical protein
MKYALSPLLFITALGLQAQEDMPVIWETKLEHRIEQTGPAPRTAATAMPPTTREMTVFDNKTGATKWTGRFKDLTPKLSKVDELIPFWESDAVFLFDRKMGKDQIAVLELATGKDALGHGQVPEPFRRERGVHPRAGWFRDLAEGAVGLRDGQDRRRTLEHRQVQRCRGPIRGHGGWQTGDGELRSGQPGRAVHRASRTRS